MTEGSTAVCEAKGRGGGQWGGLVGSGEGWMLKTIILIHTSVTNPFISTSLPPLPPSSPINCSENMSDWIFSSKSSGLGFCWSTPCQHPLKQAFNAPAQAIFSAKYGVSGREVRGNWRGRRETVRGKEGWRTKTSGTDWSHCLQL